MKLAERHIIKRGHRFWAEVDHLSWQSKNLYNLANYIIRQNWLYGHGYLSYNQMASVMKQTEAYLAMPAKVSQQVLRGLDRNWKSFFQASSEFKSHPEKFLGRPKIPKYKDTKKGRNLLVYTIQAISKVARRKGLIQLSRTTIEFQTRVAEKVASVRIVPQCDCYVIEVIYEESEQFLTPTDHIAAIDLGVDKKFLSASRSSVETGRGSQPKLLAVSRLYASVQPKLVSMSLSELVLYILTSRTYILYQGSSSEHSSIGSFIPASMDSQTPGIDFK
jgi:putative transposase